MTISSLPYTLNALRAPYANGTTPTEGIDEVFARLDAVNDSGIFIHLRNRADLRTQAAALGAYDPDQPLWRILFVAKGNIDVAGIPTTVACPAHA